MLWVTVAQSFCPNPFFPLKMVGFHYPTSAASSHLVEPPNGLKQLKMRSQWGFSQAFPLMMIKVILPFIQTKANLKITTCLTPWGPKPFLLTKNQSLRAPQTQYKFHNQIQNAREEVLLWEQHPKLNTRVFLQLKTTNHVLLTWLETLKQNPIQPVNNLTILNLRGGIWV